MSRRRISLVFLSKGVYTYSAKSTIFKSSDRRRVHYSTDICILPSGLIQMIDIFPQVVGSCIPSQFSTIGNARLSRKVYSMSSLPLFLGKLPTLVFFESTN